MRISAIALIFVFLGVAGCASLPRHVTKSRTVALADPSVTTLGRLVDSYRGSGDTSGIRLLSSGEEALQSLIALADRAERTLDIQYYIIEQDESARLLLRHVRAAADRGVRVRILVDDLNTSGEDRRFASLGLNPHIEVRLFNPFAGGRLALWTRFLFALHDIPRINHRMHNKLFVADNALAITGGRNIGDQYFVRDDLANFIDLDVIAAGNVVPQLSESFDAFWNSRYAYPIASLAHVTGGVPNTRIPAIMPVDADADWLAQNIDSGRLPLQWIPATVLADRPAKIAADGTAEGQETIADSIESLMRTATQEVVIISAYFVPGADGMALMRELAQRGVRIRILTNSLASTDSPIVYNGYAHYRKPLLELGAELYEVRPHLSEKRLRFHPFRRSLASLHAKALVIDRRTVFIGSLNMDSRSRRTNSELGLVMRSRDIARQVISLFDDISADGSYRLGLEGPSRRLQWRAEEQGSEKTWHRDPHASGMQHFWLHLLAPFAPEELL
ncbi:MAG: phospholipase D family protein [Steroidobacterales bacterium]